jgi:hypothetical protein
MISPKEYLCQPTRVLERPDRTGVEPINNAGSGSSQTKLDYGQDWTLSYTKQYDSNTGFNVGYWPVERMEIIDSGTVKRVFFGGDLGTARKRVFKLLGGF